ncbi:hypothetical protein [Actinoplanes sp. NPDC023714]|uniref:hypothetical protein n=1 Tax=Actinoplanes sp. NPDC023714 TaxID=3154322 RepID=UPI0033F85BFA
MRAYRDLFAVPEVPRLLLAIVTTRLAPPMLTLTLLLAVVDAGRLPTAFALDGVLNEALYVGGPVLVSALLLVTGPIVVLAVVAAILTTGVLLLVATPSLRRRPPARTGLRRDYLGPLATGQVRLILAVIVLSAFTFGTVMVGGPASATAAGSPHASGVLIAALSVGSVVSALIYGSRSRRGAPGPQLAVTHLAAALVLAAAGWAPALLAPAAAGWAPAPLAPAAAGWAPAPLASAAAGWAPALLVLALLLLAAGAVTGPQDTLIQVVLGEAAPERFRTEAFAWMGASTWAGYALGSAAAGQLIDLTGAPGAAFLAAAAVALLAAPLSLLVRRAAAEEPSRAR